MLLSCLVDESGTPALSLYREGDGRNPSSRRHRQASSSPSALLDADVLTSSSMDLATMCPDLGGRGDFNPMLGQEVQAPDFFGRRFSSSR